MSEPTVEAWRRRRDPRSPWRRIRVALGLFAFVLVAGSIGYMVLGLDPLDAVYQTVITVATVGYREVGDVGDSYKVFTILLILGGAGTAAYTVGVLIEALLEGRFNDEVRRRRMQRQIDELRGHVIVCGYGRVGSSITKESLRSSRDVVVIDRDVEAAARPSTWSICGEATDDDVLRRAGVGQASTLVLAMDSDADNLFVTLSARSMRPDIFIVARASSAGSVPKLYQAGADRVVNPHEIGGTRMAAVFLQPHVAEFLDVVMHDRELEVRLEEFVVRERSPFSGHSIRDCAVRERTGAIVLAVRKRGLGFMSNPPDETVLEPDDVVIALGTSDELETLHDLVRVR